MKEGQGERGCKRELNASKREERREGVRGEREERGV